METLKIYSRRREYWFESLKEHWIIWTCVSTFIAIASFWKLDASKDVPGWIFYLLLFVFFCYLTLSTVAFNTAVKAVKDFINKKEYSPSFRELKHVSLIEGTNNYRVVALPPLGLRVPVNTLVCIYKRDQYQQVIGLGKIIKENEDGSVETTVTTSEATESVWNDLQEKQKFEKIIISVLIPKEVIPKIDDYLNSENVAIQQLLTTNVNDDGEDIDL